MSKGENWCDEGKSWLDEVFGKLTKASHPNPKFFWHELIPYTENSIVSQIYEGSFPDGTGGVCEIYKTITLRDFLFKAFEIDILLEQTTQPFSD